jgi:hypothetical protein
VGAGVLAVLLVDLGLVEDAERELLDELLDVDGLDVVEVVAVLEADHGLLGLVLLLDAEHDVLADHAVEGDLIAVVVQLVERPPLYDFFGTIRSDGDVLFQISDALDPSRLEVVALLHVVDRHQVLLQLELDEVLVVEDLLQVLLGVVVELRGDRGTIVRNSLKKTPSSFCPFLLKNLKRRLIFSFSVDLKILAG